MKAFIRSGIMQAILGWILAGYMSLIRLTVRWRHENLAAARAVLTADAGVIVLLWHGRIPVALTIAPYLRETKEGRCLVSPSADGEFFAQAMAHNHFPSIRASSAKKGDSAKARAVIAAFREAMNWIKGGGVLIVTPDGPRGPNEVMAPGALQLARRTGAPVLLVGLAASPATRLSSWDRAMVAEPFGRGAGIWEGPLFVPAGADDAAIDALALDWAARLSGLTRRAEDLVSTTLPAARSGEVA